MRRVWRAVRVAVLSVLVGAAINVAVAWSCAAWAPVTRSTAPNDSRHGEWPEAMPGPDGRLGHWYTYHGFGWVEWVPPAGAACLEGRFKHWVGQGTPAIRKAGIPFLSLRSDVNVVRSADGQALSRWDLPWDEILRRGSKTSSLPSFLLAKPGRRLPLVPIWPGFLFNTLFYALVVASGALMIGPRPLTPGSAPRRR